MDPDLEHRLALLGARLRWAREARRWTTRRIADTARVDVELVERAERGDPNVTLGTYAALLAAMGLQGDLDKIAFDVVATPADHPFVGLPLDNDF